MKKRQFMVVGAGFDLACKVHGSANAPQVMREQGQLIEKIDAMGLRVVDGGSILQPRSTGPGSNPKLKYLKEVTEFSAQLREKLSNAWEQEFFPIVIGGDHSVSITSISTAASYIRKRFGAEEELGVVWIDAHADINTDATTPSGNIHGMSVAALLGLGDQSLTALCGEGPALKPHNIAYIGLRDLDQPEKDLIPKLGIQAFTMKEVDYFGIGEVCRRAFDQISKHCAGFIISFDLDVCDPSLAPAVGTPVRGGLTFRESHLIMELAAERDNFIGLEIVEFNPDTDMEGRTCQLAVGLVESALGKTIL